ERGPYLVPTVVLAEIGCMVGRELGEKVLDEVLGNIESGALQLDCGLDDVPRLRTLLTQYPDFDLEVTDAAVIACAERNGGRVLTLDRRDMEVVARGRSITPVPGW
ncbi:MAG: VapC toxin family PIN domain ribonuclease, partial [Candidatus Dormibacteraeota bacterium]|nr:VapC toxin family PIN domain ribonuclease [Candidatus Dormibacteraeota bacterium]